MVDVQDVAAGGGVEALAAAWKAENVLPVVGGLIAATIPS